MELLNAFLDVLYAVSIIFYSFIAGIFLLGFLSISAIVFSTDETDKVS